MKASFKVDSYTKAILTVIAACLVWICVRDIPVARMAHAQSIFPESLTITLRGAGEEDKAIRLSHIGTIHTPD